MKKLLLLFCVFSITLAHSQTFNDGVLEYTVTSETETEVSIKQLTCPDGDLAIPENITHESITYTVTSIEDFAFLSCESVLAITIPKSVISIGDYAFTKCINLKSVTIGEAVEYIGAFAFNECSSLESIHIPERVTSLGSSIFYSNKSLKSVTIANGLTSIPDRAFLLCTTLADISIPESVTRIGKSSFESCWALTDISIPKSVESIGDNAFGACDGLIHVTLENGLKTIGTNAFGFCSALSSIAIPETVTLLDSNAFNSCRSLTSVHVFWNTPLDISETAVFVNVDTENIPLLVPKGTEALYEAASGWQDFMVTPTLSTTDVNTQIALKIYPNPVLDNLNIRLKDGLELIQVTVYNYLGQRIRFQNKSTVDFSNLKSGLYIVEIETNQGKTFKRIIKE